MKRISPELITLRTLRRQEEKRKIRAAKVQHIAEDTGVDYFTVAARLRFIEFLLLSIKVILITFTLGYILAWLQWVLICYLIGAVLILELFFFCAFLLGKLVVSMIDNEDFFSL